MAAKLSYDFFIPTTLNGADFSTGLKKLLDTPMSERRVDYGAFYFDVSDAEYQLGRRSVWFQDTACEICRPRAIRGQARLIG